MGIPGCPIKYWCAWGGSTGGGMSVPPGRCFRACIFVRPVEGAVDDAVEALLAEALDELEFPAVLFRFAFDFLDPPLVCFAFPEAPDWLCFDP